MISCIRVSKSYGGRQVLSDVTLAVQPKEWVTIVGNSRSGKSTLTRLLLRLEEPDHGSIEVDGVPLHSLPSSVLQLYRARVGTILQEPLLHENDTVLDAVLLPLDLRSVNRERSTSAALSALKTLGLSGREHADISTLSQSERMLVCIARAVVHHPMILLADDPTARLDAQQTEAVLSLLREAHTSGMTVVFLTSNARMAAQLPGRAVRLDQGRIVAPALAETQQKTATLAAAPTVASTVTPDPIPEKMSASTPTPTPAPAIAATPTQSVPARVTLPQRPAPPVPPTLAAAFPALRSLQQSPASPAPADQPIKKNPHARKPPVRGMPRISKNGIGPGIHVPKQPDAVPALQKDTDRERDDNGGHRIKITSIGN